MRDNSQTEKEASEDTHQAGQTSVSQVAFLLVVPWFSLVCMSACMQHTCVDMYMG